MRDINITIIQYARSILASSAKDSYNCGQGPHRASLAVDSTILRRWYTEEDSFDMCPVSKLYIARIIGT